MPTAMLLWRLLACSRPGHQGDDCVMIRMVLTVFGVDFHSSQPFGLRFFRGWCGRHRFGRRNGLGSAGDQRMLAYLIVAEVGYMVGGVWVFN